MELPVAFLSTIRNTFGQDGERFLATLPESISEACARWNLTNVRPVPTLSYNFVAFAKSPSPIGGPTGVLREGARSEGSEVVLKMGVPNREFKSEMAALRLFNGEGACRLIEYDEEKYWMVLERLKPGVILATLEDDEEATQIAAEVMQKIWRPLESASVAVALWRHWLAENGKQVSGLQSFIRLSDWFDGLKRLRTRFNGGTGPLNERLVDRVERSVKDFFAENHKPVLLHGDFHHFNILSSMRGWLIIDPKGVIGPACYEVGPLLINPWGDLLGKKDYRRMTRRRIEVLHERLGFERERIREWGLAHAVLSAWWGIEDNTGWEYSLTFAEMLADLSIK
jgi:streptomycin 6-kinase